MRALPESPLFSRADALAAGWTDAALCRAVRSGHIARIRKNQYADITLKDDPLIQAIAAQRECCGSVVSHRSATLLHGLPLLRPIPFRPDLTVLPRRTGDVRSALLHRAQLREADVSVVNGVPATSPARTLGDLARVSTLGAAVAAGDAALNRGLVTAQSLDEVNAMCGSWPRGKNIARAFAALDSRSESALESVSRVAIASHGIEAADLQVDVLMFGTDFVGRLDFYWDEYGVAGEADGRLKYDSRDVLMAEKRRQERLETLGLVVVRWGWDDVTRRPDELARRLRAAFERGRARDGAGIPRVWATRPAARTA